MPVTLTFHGGTVRIEGLDRDALSPDLPGLEVPLSPEERESYDRECAPCAEAAQVVPVDRVLPRHDGLAGIGADVLLVVGTFVQALASRPFP